MTLLLSEFRSWVGAKAVQFSDREIQAAIDRARPAVELATAHAPEGGTSVGGKPFKGGQFLPADDGPHPHAAYHAIPKGELGFVQGFPVRRLDEKTWRLQEPTHAGRVVGSAADIHAHVEQLHREQTNAAPMIAAALARADAAPELNPFKDWDQLEAHAAAFDRLPHGALVVSLADNTHGRLGKIVRTTDHEGRRVNKVQLHGIEGWSSGDVEPLDLAHSWRVPGREPEPVMRMQQGRLFSVNASRLLELATSWTEDEHPRGRDGKFIDAGTIAEAVDDENARHSLLRKMDSENQGKLFKLLSRHVADQWEEEARKTHQDVEPDDDALQDEAIEVGHPPTDAEAEKANQQLEHLGNPYRFVRVMPDPPTTPEQWDEDNPEPEEPDEEEEPEQHAIWKKQHAAWDKQATAAVKASDAWGKKYGDQWGEYESPFALEKPKADKKTKASPGKLFSTAALQAPSRSFWQRLTEGFTGLMERLRGEPDVAEELLPDLAEVEAWLKSGEWLEVESTNVKAIRWLADDEALQIEFLNHGFYQYQNVNETEARDFALSPSKGSWVWDNLRLRGTVFGYQKDYTFISGPSDYSPSWMGQDQAIEQRGAAMRQAHGLIPPSGDISGLHFSGAPVWTYFVGPHGKAGHCNLDTGDVVYGRIPAAGLELAAKRYAAGPGLFDEPAAGWSEYFGPKGGHGWRSSLTGRIRYVAEKPGEHEHHGANDEEPEPIYLATGRPQWSVYIGPKGGRGWRSTVTGRIRYVREMPGGNEHEGPHDEESVGPPVAPSTVRRQAVPMKKGAFAHLKTEDIHGITGAASGPLAGATVKVYDMGQTTEISIRHPLLSEPAERTLGIDADGKKYIHNDLLKLKDKGKGPGLKIFASQVEHAIRHGFDRIECHAAGGQGYKGDWSGYYVWPLYGYDQKISQLESGDDEERKCAAGLRKAFPEAESILDLMDTPEGAKWWSENGTGLRDAVFDLKEGSRSLKVLRAYQAKKAAKK